MSETKKEKTCVWTKKNSKKKCYVLKKKKEYVYVKNK